MVTQCASLAAATMVVVLAAMSGASANELMALTPERQTYLEGEWHGVTVDTNASKLCSPQSPPTVVFAFEFQNTGGLAFYDGGRQEDVGRKPITAAQERDNLISLTLAGQMEPWTFRADGPNVMALVRNSASLGLPVDTMVFKRCKPAADRSAINLTKADLRAFASEMPGDFPFFVDTRIASKAKDACTAAKTQYLFFGLAGPVEFRVSRWNSFDLSDAMTGGAKPAFPIDPIGDWQVLSAAKVGEALQLSIQPRDQQAMPPQTITLKMVADRLQIPEWGRDYVRCTNFQNRS